MSISRRLAASVLAAGTATTMLLLGLVQAGAKHPVVLVTTSGSKVIIEGLKQSVRLDMGEPVHAAVLSPSGKKVAVASGSPVEVDIGGVVGNVAIVDVETGEVLLRTEFEGAVITDLTYSPQGRRIAFVKDYDELWLLDLRSGALRRLMRAPLPLVSGAVLFDPAFSSGGEALYVGVVEETFHGEDDKLDNLWRISLDGSAERVTDLRLDEGEEWKVLRGPTPLPDGRVLLTIGTDRGPWRAALLNLDGSIAEVGPVPPLTSPVAAGRGQMIFKCFSWKSTTFHLYTVRTDLTNPSWEVWCQESCEVLEKNVSEAAVLFPGVPIAPASR